MNAPFSDGAFSYHFEVIPMLHVDNERLLTLISEYLTFTPNAIKPEDVTSLCADCGLTPHEAYLALLAAHCGLDFWSPLR